MYSAAAWPADHRITIHDLQAATDQILVWQDMAGLTEGRLPRFVKRYAGMRDVLAEAAHRYVSEVASRHALSAATPVESAAVPPKVVAACRSSSATSPVAGPNRPIASAVTTQQAAM